MLSVHKTHNGKLFSGGEFSVIKRIYAAGRVRWDAPFLHLQKSVKTEDLKRQKK